MLSFGASLRLDPRLPLLFLDRLGASAGLVDPEANILILASSVVIDMACHEKEKGRGGKGRESPLASAFEAPARVAVSASS